MLKGRVRVHLDLNDDMVITRPLLNDTFSPPHATVPLFDIILEQLLFGFLPMTMMPLLFWILALSLCLIYFIIPQIIRYLECEAESCK